MKKVISVVMVIMIIMSFNFVAFADDDNTITIAVMDKGKIAASEGTMENNRWTTWMREQTGLDLKWVSLPRNGFKDSLNNLVAVGEAPDILIEYDLNFFSWLADEELIMPLDDLIENHSVEYKAYIEEHPETNKYTNYNGKTYAFTSLAGGNLNGAMWIRTDWLEQLGLPIPSTIGELLDTARAFKNAKLGGENTIPLVLNNWKLDGFFSFYQAGSANWYVDENGKVEFGPITNRYQVAIDFLKTAYDEGLILKDFPTDTDLALQKQLWINGNAGILFDQWHGTLNYDLLSNNPDAEIVSMPPIETEFGLNCYAKGKGINYLVAINSECKNPVGAMKFLDWMISKGWKVLDYGFEGVHYNVVDGRRVASSDDNLRAQIKYTPLYAILAQEESSDKEIIQNASPDEISQRVAKLAVDSYNMLQGYKFRVDVPRTPDVESYTDLYADWSITYESLFIKAITSGEKYTSEMLMMDLRNAWYDGGGAKVEMAVQAWYDANKVNWN